MTTRAKEIKKSSKEKKNETIRFLERDNVGNKRLELDPPPHWKTNSDRAFLGIMGAQLRTPLKRPVHRSNIVSKGVREALN